MAMRDACVFLSTLPNILDMSPSQPVDTAMSTVWLGVSSLLEMSRKSGKNPSAADGQDCAIEAP